MNWPGQECESRARIRFVLLTTFRKWFGRSPTHYYHKDGCTADAWDERGNHITVDQVNQYCPFLGPLPVVPYRPAFKSLPEMSAFVAAVTP